MLKKIGKLSILLVVFQIILLIGFTKQTNALSFMPAVADPWFVLSVGINSTNLPSGILIEKDKIKNLNTVPLYYYYEVENVHEKLESGKRYYWGYRNTGYMEMYTDGWLQIDPLDKLLVLDRPIENITRDNRPADVTLPKPHTFSRKAKYGEKEILITGTISYTLNPNYKPNAVEEAKTATEKEVKGWDREQQFKKTWKNITMNLKEEIPFVAGLLILVAVSVIIIRRNKKHKI